MEALVSVPVEESTDLEGLKPLGTGEELGSQPYDGATIASVLVPLTSASVPVLRAWIISRFDAKKSQSVTIGGVKFEGYDAQEVQELLSELDALAADQRSESDGASS